MKDYYFPNLVGNPLDTTLTAGHLIFSGIFDRFPGIKIVLSHAGGHLPYIIGRMGHGFKVRPECQEVIKKSPVEYLSQVLFRYDLPRPGSPAIPDFQGGSGPGAARDGLSL